MKKIFTGKLIIITNGKIWRKSLRKLQNTTWIGSIRNCVIFKLERKRKLIIIIIIMMMTMRIFIIRTSNIHSRSWKWKFVFSFRFQLHPRFCFIQIYIILFIFFLFAKVFSLFSLFVCQFSLCHEEFKNKQMKKTKEEKKRKIYT